MPQSPHEASLYQNDVSTGWEMKSIKLTGWYLNAAVRGLEAQLEVQTQLQAKAQTKQNLRNTLRKAQSNFSTTAAGGQPKTDGNWEF